MNFESELIVGPFYQDVPRFPYYRAGINGVIWTQYQRINYGGKIRILTELTNIWRKAPIMYIDRNRNKYLRINLWDGQQCIKYTVHTIILETFVGPCPVPEMQCRHLDGNRRNNSINNLCWGWAFEDGKDRIKHNTTCKNNLFNAKLTQAIANEIRRRLFLGETQQALATEFKVSKHTINDIFRNKTWKEQ